MQHGMVKVTWLDIVLQMLNDSSISMESGKSSLQAKIFEISPEHASKLNDWKNVRTMMTRVCPEARGAHKAHGYPNIHGPGGLEARGRYMALPRPRRGSFPSNSALFFVRELFQSMLQLFIFSRLFSKHIFRKSPLIES